MKKLFAMFAIALGMVTTSVYADCYSDSFDVKVNRKLLKCDNTQRAYSSGGAIQGGITAVCSKENTSSPVVRTAIWVANFYEGTSGTSSSYGRNCYFNKITGWKCKKWIKKVKVDINPHNCLDFDDTYEYAVVEQ